MGTLSKFSNQTRENQEIETSTKMMDCEAKGDIAGVEEKSSRLTLNARRNPRPSKNMLNQYKISKCFQSNMRSSVFGAVNRRTRQVVVLKSSQYSEAMVHAYDRIVKSSPEETSGLIRPKDFYIDEDRHVQLVLPYVKGGDLIEQILDAGPMSENEVRIRMRSVARGLRFLHDEVKVAHRDISPENILIDEGDETILIDYGSCRRLVDKTRDTHGVKLTYLAPELLKQHVSSDASSVCDLRKSDVWSLGCVIFVALFGIPPFETASLGDERFRHLKKYGFHSYIHAMMGPRLDVSDSALDLLQSMLDPNPELRPTCIDILSHSWFEVEA